MKLKSERSHQVWSRDVIHFRFYAVTKTVQETEILARSVCEIFLFSVMMNLPKSDQQLSWNWL